jgi:hypothetical protein
MSDTSLEKYIPASLTLFADFSRHYAKKQSRREITAFPGARLVHIAARYPAGAPLNRFTRRSYPRFPASENNLN